MTHKFEPWCRIAGVLLVLTPAAAGQERQAKNPRDADAAAIQEGREIFRSGRCADCHGLDARGVRGPDLTGLWESGASDDRLFQTVRRGIPGSEMPAFTGTDEQVWAVLAYLHSMNSPVPIAKATGNPDQGAEIFRARCQKCHRVNGQGGDLGPDLSRIATRRSRTALAGKIRDASSYIIVTGGSSSGMPINALRRRAMLRSPW